MANKKVKVDDVWNKNIEKAIANASKSTKSTKKTKRK